MKYKITEILLIIFLIVGIIYFSAFDLGFLLGFRGG